MNRAFPFIGRPWSRRDFVRTSTKAAAITAATAVVPVRRLLGSPLPSRYMHMTGAPTIGDQADQDFMRTLVLSAIDAARSAGAQYADARVSRIVFEDSESHSDREGWQLRSDSEYIAIGVRVLAQGAWGFAGSTYWTKEEPALLAKEAVSQARINAALSPQQVELGKYPVVTGTWRTPIQIDPFQISLEEKLDFLDSLEGIVPRHVKGRYYGLMRSWRFLRKETMVANSDGSCFSQTLFSGGAGLRLQAQGILPDKTKDNAEASAHGGTGGGWEHVLGAKFIEQIPALVDEVEANLFLPIKPVDPGRYEMVMSANVVAQLLALTVGNATQLDRALGYEANAGGTSYLGPDPMKYLGTPLGSSFLTVQGNRSQSGGLATVKWDDEGVEPETFSLIQDGTFVDYQTTREQASWLSSWYQSQRRPIRSHGCATAPTAKDFPMQHTPNLSMKPAADSRSFEEMVASTTRGIAYFGGFLRSDFQSRTGMGGGRMREIVNGKLGAVLISPGLIFESSQLWKKLLEIGGADSAEMIDAYSSKGEPAQSTSYSVTAVPGRFKDMTIIDEKRKA